MKTLHTSIALLLLASTGFCDRFLTTEELAVQPDSFRIRSYENHQLAVGETLEFEGDSSAIRVFKVSPPEMFGLEIDYVPQLHYRALLTDAGAVEATFDRDGQYMIRVRRADGTLEESMVTVGNIATYSTCHSGSQKAFPCPADSHQYVGDDVDHFDDGFTNRKVVTSVQDLVDKVTADFTANNNQPIDITIADHGCSGSFTINGTDKVSLDPADAANLATFCSLNGKVCSITLIACSSAAGAAGNAFICHLSQCLGGIQVKAWKTDISVKPVTHVWSSANPTPLVKGNPWNATPPTNDTPATPTPTFEEELVVIDTRYAGTDGDLIDPTLFPPLLSGDPQLHNDLWFCFLPPFPGTWEFALDLPFQSELALYLDPCGAPLPQQLLFAQEFEPGIQIVPLDLVSTQPIVIRVGGAAPDQWGVGSLWISEDAQLGMVYDNVCNGNGGDQAGCTECPCNNNAPVGVVGGCLNAVGTSARLHALGNARQSNDTLRFEVSGARPDTFAVLVSGDNIAPISPSHPCYGTTNGVPSFAFDGLRCAVGNVLRHGPRAIDSNGDIGVTTGGWGAPDGPIGGIMAHGGFAPGQTRSFQVIYRENPDEGCGRGQNTTQAVTVTFQP